MSSNSSSSDFWTEFRKEHPAATGPVPEGWYPAGYEDELYSEDKYSDDAAVVLPVEIVIMDGKPVGSDKPLFSW